jgi:hypothetical protein
MRFIRFSGEGEGIMGMDLNAERNLNAPDVQAADANQPADLGGRLLQEVRNLAEGAVFGAAAVGIGRAAAGAVREMLQPNPARAQFENIPLGALDAFGKKELNTGHILSKFDGSISVGTGRFSQNPPVGWYMNFDKTGALTQADGVKKISSENGITTFKANDGSRIVIDIQGLLKITNGANITSFARPARAEVPNLKIVDGQKEAAGKIVNEGANANKPVQEAAKAVKEGDGDAAVVAAAQAAKKAAEAAAQAAWAEKMAALKAAIR